MADAPDRRGESLGRHHSVAHVRPFDLLFPHHRRGHVTKMWALVYAPLMMGGAWLTLRGNMCSAGRSRPFSPRSKSAPTIRRSPTISCWPWPRCGSAKESSPSEKAPAFVRPPHGGTAGRRHSGRRLELRSSVVHDAPLETDHPRRFGTRRRRGNLPGRVGTRLRYGLELRTRRKLEPVDSRLHGRDSGRASHATAR